MQWDWRVVGWLEDVQKHGIVYLFKPRVHPNSSLAASLTCKSRVVCVSRADDHAAVPDQRFNGEISCRCKKCTQVHIGGEGSRMMGLLSAAARGDAVSCRSRVRRAANDGIARKMSRAVRRNWVEKSVFVWNRRLKWSAHSCSATVSQGYTKAPPVSGGEGAIVRWASEINGSLQTLNGYIG